MGEINEQKSKEAVNHEITGIEREKVGYKHPPKEHQFKIGNPGRQEGTKNFDTLFEEAIKIIVKEQKIPGLKNPEIDLVIKAVIEGLKGNYQYFRDIMDRRFGKPKESVDLTSGGEPLGIIYLPRRKQDENKQLNETNETRNN